MAHSGKNNGSLVPAVAYVRMSSDKQEASPAQQREAITNLAAEKGYTIVREYVDEGISGDETEKLRRATK